MKSHAIALSFAACAMLAGTAIAQSPYAGMQARPIKALSEQQIADLRTGRGMGLALPAELNGYPGPMHLLELADRLDLSAEQRERFGGLIESMKAEAIPLGERLIEEERALNALFAERKVTADNLASATAAVARIQGELRLTHLKYHLATTEALTPRQLQLYAELRGYADAVPAGQHHRRH